MPDMNKPEWIVYNPQENIPWLDDKGYYLRDYRLDGETLIWVVYEPKTDTVTCGISYGMQNGSEHCVAIRDHEIVSRRSRVPIYDEKGGLKIDPTATDAWLEYAQPFFSSLPSYIYQKINNVASKRKTTIAPFSKTNN